MDEQAWIARAKEGDHEAFEWLVRKYDSFLKNHISYYVGRAFVQDAAQEIWILIYKKLWQLEDDHKIMPWMRKLVYFQCVNYRKHIRRKRGKEQFLDFEQWSMLVEGVSRETFSVQELIEKQELKREISQALDYLPGDYGAVLRLRYYRELSYQEIYEITQLPLSTIKWRIYQGKKLLKAHLIKKIKMKGSKVHVRGNE